MRKNILTIILVSFSFFSAFAQSKFLPLDDQLPAPNEYRTAAGTPGAKYWQQRADYEINVKLDDEKQSISGDEWITIYNNAPETLPYVWVQLDQNIYHPESITNTTEHHSIHNESISSNQIHKMLAPFDGGYKIAAVKDKKGNNLKYVINNTMMRIELPKPLTPQSSQKIYIAWSYNITNQPLYGGRSGYEYFAKDENYIYEIAQFFPRMAVYTDYLGWQNKQFLGEAEFALPFGNYKVNITVPSDHVLAATGVLQNANNILSKDQLSRLAKARSSDKAVMIVTEEEAKSNEKSQSSESKTWTFKAENVRDFAFASSKKYIWEAQNVKIGKNNVLAMSLYPKEASSLWGKYATASVVHALKVYSKYSLDYPYPVAIAVHGPVFGMEYPMISFNGARPDENGNYSERLKQILISVIIHETGHNFFPMIINSDERKWAWMDEGLNSFIQYLAEQEWEKGYPSRRGPAHKMADFMKQDKNQVPIMTNPESIIQMGNITYGKTATALAILREVVMGPELFDYAFKEYCKKWAFKSPTPADFFRAMQDASAVDLDWFWRGWFYTTDHVDIAIDQVKYSIIDKSKPDDNDDKTIEGVDFNSIYNQLSADHKKLIDKNLNFYEIRFKNLGGLVSPVILELEYADGTKTIQNIPAEIWRKNDAEVVKVIASEKKIKQIKLDPERKTADADLKNNVFVVSDKPELIYLKK
jgi:hypothetical protein